MHPATRFIIAICFVFAALKTGVPLNFVIVLLGLLYAFSVKSRSGFNPSSIFARMLVFALVVLFLIHGVDFHTHAISQKGLRTAGNAGVRFASVFAATLWLVKRTTKEELYALMLSLKLPMVATLLIFRAIWFLPHVSKRVRDVLLAHQLRGVKSSNVFRRSLALAPALYAIFASMLLEICDSSVTLLSKGIWIHGPKSSFLVLRWSYKDWMAVGAAGLMIVMLLFKGCYFARS
ncbi:MAG: energy-coupling factor transporter transmembrane component T [Syntrophobacteraceae bacterium]|nr:energy-coupling factor transporter transmembrane component T [Syntrophobacteraceae bacterium]